MAKSDSSVFKKGYNKVDRRVVVPAIKGPIEIPVPAGFWPRRVYAQNRSTTATNITVGNAAAGAQYLASTAVPVAAGGVPGVLYPTETLKTAVPANPGTNSSMHVTLSAYPTVGTGANARGQVDVVVEYEELYGSLDIPEQHARGLYGY